MPGYNHYPDCTCGWCGGSGNGQPFDVAPYWLAHRATENSYTIPNALCPVCRASVFFYRSPYGGRVFFDNLGPPWPKHGCTDNSRVSVPASTTPAPSRVPDWKQAGWEPVRIAQVVRKREWAWLKINRCAGSGFIVRVTRWREGLLPGAPAHIKPLDKFGLGRISVLIARERDWLPAEDILAHQTFVASTPEILDAARNGDADNALKIARAAYRPWLWKPRTPPNEKSRPFLDPPKGKYQSCVDLGMARQWLERATALGSGEAKIALETEPEFRIG